MNESLVSIVIPCYNDAQYIEQSVDSAYNQTYSNKEIIVVDDGSNQETKVVLQKLKDKINKLITQENQGVIKTRNTAIKLAKGEYILTLDSDDYFDKSFLEKAVKILKDNYEVGMVTCWSTKVDEKGIKLGKIKHSGATASETIFYNNAPASLLFRKSCWQEVGGYDENLIHGDEDWEFNVAVGKKGWKVHVIAEELFTYRIRKNTRHNTAVNFRKKTRRYTFNKHEDLLKENMERTIDFFLDEIEDRERSVNNLKGSKSYQIGYLFLRPYYMIKGFFSRKK